MKKEHSPDPPPEKGITIERTTLKAIIEALLFVATEPLKPRAIQSIFEEDIDVSEKEINALVRELGGEYSRDSRGFAIVEIAGGYRLQTLPEYGKWIARLRAAPTRRKLSAPSMETLAIIAYRQPITKAEIEAIRGVSVDGVIDNLVERELIEIRGRKKAVGKPFLYGTTRKFLEHFGLRSLRELPQIEELKRAVTKTREEKSPELESGRISLNYS